MKPNYQDLYEEALKGIEKLSKFETDRIKQLKTQHKEQIDKTLKEIESKKININKKNKGLIKEHFDSFNKGLEQSKQIIKRLL